MYRNPELPSLARRLGLSFLLGFALFGLGVLVQIVLEHFSIRGTSAYADDLMVGALAGLLVFVYEQERHKAVMERVRIIAAMNHHVRNALQAITFSPYAEHPRQIELIQDASHRIQWALDEILPGADQHHDVPGEIEKTGLSRPAD